MKFLKLMLPVGLILFISNNVLSQIDCSSHRFDQEVFSAITTTSNIIYGNNVDANGASQDLTMDVYEPAGDTMAARPLIVWAHGGSFISGTKNDVDVVSLSQHFAKRGYVCVSINYRLGIPFPINQESALKAVYRSVQDMKAAVRFFRKDAATSNLFKINPNIIFAGGSSAGAFAALHLAYLDKYNELPITIDTVAMGTLEGSSGNPGYASNVNAIIDLCGALGSRTYVEAGDIPFVAMHGNQDGTVPYATAMINLLGAFPIMVVDGSYSIARYADSISVHNEMYTYYGADHVPYVSSTAYMDTTVRFVSNFLYRFLGCTPTDPLPLANTFPTGTNEILFADDIRIYPNPAADNINIRINSEKKYSIRISEVNGRKVYEKHDLSGRETIDISIFSPGVYFYTIENDKSIFSGKLIKQ